MHVNETGGSGWCLMRNGGAQIICTFGLIDERNGTRYECVLKLGVVMMLIRSFMQFAMVHGIIRIYAAKEYED